MEDYTVFHQNPRPGEKVPALVRHLRARLEEFEDITLVQCQELEGVVEFSFAGIAPTAMVAQLEEMGIRVALGEDTICLYLRDCHAHEMNDRIWGGLYRLYAAKQA